MILLLGKLSLGALLLVGGGVGDHFGHKRIMLLGIAGVVVASAVSALAPTPWLLGAGRTLDGIGNALIGPLALAVCVLTFPADMRARIVGLFLGVSGAGIIIGPFLASFLIQIGGWRLGFAAALVLGLLGGLVIALEVPTVAPDREQHPLDLISMALCVLGLTGLVLGLVLAANQGLLAAAPLALTAGGIVCLAVFAWWDLRIAAYPLVDRKLLGSREVLVAITAALLMALVLNGTVFPFLYLMQRVQGNSPLGATLRLAPLILAALVMAPLAGRLAERFGRRQVIAVGLLLVAAGSAIFTSLTAEAPYLPLMVGLILAGAGVMTVITPAADLVMATTEASQSGSAAALTAAVIQIGGAIGIGVVTAIFIDAAQARFLDQMGLLGVAPDQAAAFMRSLSEAVRDTALHEVPPLPQTTVELHQQLVGAYARAVVAGVDRTFALATLLALLVIPLVLIGMPRRIRAR